MASDVGGVDPSHHGVLAALAAIGGAALGAFGLWLANRLLGKAAFQTAINDGFAKLTKELQEERDVYRRELTKERIEWAGERATLQGEIRNLMQSIESLKNELRRHGIAIPQGSVVGREPLGGVTIIERRDPPETPED